MNEKLDTYLWAEGSGDIAMFQAAVDYADVIVEKRRGCRNPGVTSSSTKT
jgi:hypothetical protein